MNTILNIKCCPRCRKQHGLFVQTEHDEAWIFVCETCGYIEQHGQVPTVCSGVERHDNHQEGVEITGQGHCQRIRLQPKAVLRFKTAGSNLRKMILSKDVEGGPMSKLCLKIWDSGVRLDVCVVESWDETAVDFISEKLPDPDPPEESGADACLPEDPFADWDEVIAAIEKAKEGRTGEDPMLLTEHVGTAVFEVPLKVPYKTAMALLEGKDIPKQDGV